MIEIKDIHKIGKRKLDQGFVPKLKFKNFFLRHYSRQPFVSFGFWDSYREYRLFDLVILWFERDWYLVQESKMAAVRLHQMEYFLQGSVNKSNVENLLCRLEGLCDNTSHERDKFSDHEIVYSLREFNDYYELVAGLF